MVIAAKTGQGKTLCFGLPILDLLIKKIQKHESRMESSEDESDKSSSEENKENKPKRKKDVFTSCKALILSPTRELAI